MYVCGYMVPKADDPFKPKEPQANDPDVKVIDWTNVRMIDPAPADVEVHPLERPGDPVGLGDVDRAQHDLAVGLLRRGGRRGGGAHAGLTRLGP